MRLASLLLVLCPACLSMKSPQQIEAMSEQEARAELGKAESEIAFGIHDSRAEQYATDCKWRIVSFHNEWDADERSKIVYGILWIGMSEDQARLTWGEPQGVNTSISAHSQAVVWTYMRARSCAWLHFEDGKLVLIEQ